MCAPPSLGVEMASSLSPTHSHRPPLLLRAAARAACACGVVKVCCRVLVLPSQVQRDSSVYVYFALCFAHVCWCSISVALADTVKADEKQSAWAEGVSGVVGWKPSGQLIATAQRSIVVSAPLAAAAAQRAREGARGERVRETVLPQVVSSF